jgi:hypothetical protein
MAILVDARILDPLYLAGSVAVLVLASVAAGPGPALRAAHTDPLLSLKTD